MRTLWTPLIFAGTVFLAAGCTEADRAERARERADEQIAEAREQLDEAREQLDEARESIHESMRDAAEDAADETGILAGLGKAFEDLGRKLQDHEGGVEPVDFRKLRDLLPDEVAGMDRVNTNGERSGAIGIRVSHVEGEYEGRDRYMEIDLVDLGTLKGLAGSKDWLGIEVDREGDDGVERTTRIDGHPARIKAERRSAEAVVIVSSRFVVKIDIHGPGADLDMLEDVIEEIGLSRLERLAS